MSFLLEDVQCLLVRTEKDLKFLEMVYKNAREQLGVDKTDLQMYTENIGFLGVFGKTVHFKLSSSYTAGNKASKVIERVFKRLYTTKGKRHDIYVLIPKEKIPISFTVIIAPWDRDAIDSKTKKI